MRLLILGLILLCTANVYGQITFRKYFQSSGNNLPRNGCYVPGGGYIVCASGNSFYRLDPAGNVLWATVISSPVYIENVAVSSDTCFVFSGYTYNIGPFSQMSEIAAGKIDQNGNVLWISVIDSTNKMIKTIPVATNDGGVMICTTEPTTLLAGDFMVGLARFSSTGQLVWHKIIEGNPWTNYLLDVDHSGNAFVASARVDTTAWLFGFDDQCTVSWSTKNNSLPNFMYSPVDVERISTGLVITHKLNNLFFFDTLGNAITERKYSVVGGTLTLENLLGTSDGGLLVGGRVITNGGDSLMLLLKTDGAGNVGWATTYDTTVRYIRNMEETPDGFIITRERFSTSEFMVLKTDLQGHAFCGESNVVISMTPVAGLLSPVQGNVVTNSWAQSYYQPTFSVMPKIYTEWTSCSSVGISETPIASEWIIYPNPSAGIFYLDASLNAKADVAVYSMSGQLIRQRTSNEYFIDLSDQPDGIYLLEIVEGEKKYFRKLVISH